MPLCTYVPALDAHDEPAVRARGAAAREGAMGALACVHIAGAWPATSAARAMKSAKCSPNELPEDAGRAAGATARTGLAAAGRAVLGVAGATAALATLPPSGAAEACDACMSSSGIIAHSARDAAAIRSAV